MKHDNKALPDIIEGNVTDSIHMYLDGGMTGRFLLRVLDLVITYL